MKVSATLQAQYAEACRDWETSGEAAAWEVTVTDGPGRNDWVEEDWAGPNVFEPQ